MNSLDDSSASLCAPTCMASASGPSPVEIVQLSGPLLIGYLLHWGLFGTLTLQLYLYYEAFPKDRLATKCLVYTVYVFALVQTIIITHDTFGTFGYGFGDLSALMAPHLEWLTVPIMGGLVALIGQSFYAYRVYVLSRHWSIPVLIVVISLISCVGGFLTGSFIKEVGNLTLLADKRGFREASTVWLGGSALSDILIAVCMTYYLTKHDTGFRQTHALVLKLIRITIETGSLTALVALTSVALSYVFPTKPYALCAGAIIPQLYANTILAVLNARMQILGGRGYAAAPETISTPSYLRNNERSVFPSASHSTQNPVVAFSREVFLDKESDDLVEMKGMNVRSLLHSGIQQN
ncbi:hypothetical protein DFH09DRAFT_1369158 [Mycena vulgaris]|nr:hypothetical protein DFH09DRAFT_1369158 [Mycena vulgaris]